MNSTDGLTAICAIVAKIQILSRDAISRIQTGAATPELAINRFELTTNGIVDALTIIFNKPAADLVAALVTVEILKLRAARKPIT